MLLSLPDDTSYDEIMKKLAFERMVDRGLEDVRARAGRVISNDEMAARKDGFVFFYMGITGLLTFAPMISLISWKFFTVRCQLKDT